MKKELYINTGAPFPRRDGTTWDRGVVDVPTLDEIARLKYKLKRYFKPVVPQTQPTQEELKESFPDATDGASEQISWPLKMSPETYISLHPNGPHIETAKRLVAEAAEEEEDGEADEEEEEDGEADE